MVKGKGYCRPCNNKYGKKYYSDNREKRLKAIAVNVIALRKRRRELVDGLKNRPCMDCGGIFPAVCMDFDHRDPTQKEATISLMVSHKGTSMNKLIKELEKCDLICSNCHRIRTHITRNPGVAQVVEHTTDNREVGASIAFAGTKD
jgi:hypothetical protein